MTLKEVCFFNFNFIIEIGRGGGMHPVAFVVVAAAAKHTLPRNIDG